MMRKKTFIDFLGGHPTKRILSVMLVLSLLCSMVVPITAQATTEEDYTYSIADGNVTITGYTGAGGNILIPSSLEGHPVVSIGASAFKNCTNLASVTIPDSVTSIGYAAFSYCTGLTNVTIPDSVTSIGMSAFSGCRNLESMTIPFVGNSRKTGSDTYQYPFGYIFGTTNNDYFVSATQYYTGADSGYATSGTYSIHLCGANMSKRHPKA